MFTVRALRVPMQGTPFKEADMYIGISLVGLILLILLLIWVF